jgi:exopolysaccharide biosynthesis polyprenyl glycosylphosphotransferase
MDMFAIPQQPNSRNVIVIGTGPRVQSLIRAIDNNRQLGLKITGIVDPDNNRVGQIIESYRVIGVAKDLPGMIRQSIIDVVIVIIPQSLLKEIEPTVACLEKMGVLVLFAIDYFKPSFVVSRQSKIFGLQFLTFGQKPHHPLLMMTKRVMDVVLSFIGIVILSPIFLITALVVKFTSDGPIFFVQKRIGRNGRIFYFYKFRTMVKDAEQKLNDLLSKNEMKGPAFKITNDPRLTSIGGFLRKASIDELPQFFNVLKGDMSLVGPRPPLPSEISSYHDWHWRRLSMRPGITCLWQIKGRNTIVDFDKCARLDLQYIDNWSLKFDLIILLKTIPVVLFAKGAK